MTSIPLSQLERIVVFRTDHIGDLIVSTPFLRALRQAAPRAHLTAVVAAPAAGVLAGNPSVDEVLTLDQWSPPKKIDLAVALSPRTATYKLVAATGARYRAGYYYPERLMTRIGCKLWLTHALAMPVRRWLGQGSVPHEIEQHARLAEFLGFPVADKTPLLPVPDEDLSWGRAEVGQRIAIHLSANWFSHGWQPADFVQFCSVLPPLLVTYGPGEMQLVEQLRALNWPHGLYGGLSLRRWAAVLAGARAVVSTDTGAVHVAAAHGRPVVVVYKPEQYELCRQQWHPWGVDYRTLILGDPTTSGDQVRQALQALSPSASP